jgi:tRNA-dihydrouridine synthase B
MRPAEKDSDQCRPSSVLTQLCGVEEPVILAPLAGVSDYPFRLLCQEQGADLTYVEMLSATALIHHNTRTKEMMGRHPSEKCLGVQLTGRNADEIGDAVHLLDQEGFATIDINMGCPVRKIVAVGCGSAILRDPERVYQTCKKAREATKKPLSAKIRLGWSREELNYLEIVDACVRGGVDWLVVHGRTRSESYADKVDLEAIKLAKQRSSVPLVANGNLFHSSHLDHVRQITGADAWMISRGSLGNPWVFAEIRCWQNQQEFALSPETWLVGVLRHLELQEEAFGDSRKGVVCMRKHLGWYLKGWPASSQHRESCQQIESLSGARELVERMAQMWCRAGIAKRQYSYRGEEMDFAWDPKNDMDRRLDRGIEIVDPLLQA